MKIYLLTQGDVAGYDTYDSCVVVAKSEEDAKNTHPAWYKTFGEDRGSWTDNVDKVCCTYLGEYVGEHVEKKVICASFNAG